LSFNPLGVQINIADVYYILEMPLKHGRNAEIHLKPISGDTNALLVANASHMHKYNEKCISVIISTALVPTEISIPKCRKYIKVGKRDIRVSIKKQK
jgi:hypothetical protein